MCDDCSPPQKEPDPNNLYCPNCENKTFEIRIVSSISAFHDCTKCHQRFRLVYSTSFKRTSPRLIKLQV
ncbi:hypothetical protein ES703_69166 [subsurface metagenome]